MNNILYISYGAGLHQQEVAFSLLSALHRSCQQADDLRFLIFTDHPADFADLPATVEFVEPRQWLQWSGPTRFNHRSKILALQHALRKYGTTALLDADTWFRKPPQELFKRIAPGKAIMHIREARICEVATPEGRRLTEFVGGHRFLSFGGQETAIPFETDIWNAGVIGLHPADLDVLNEVLHLTDQFCAQSSLHILEQLAFSIVLAQRKQLGETHDVVFHYWPPYLHEPFRQRLPAVLRDCAGLSLKERAARCYAQRPRPTLTRRGKVILKRCLQAAGLLRGRIRSNEW